ncbi:MAG TPA: hypothetical protein VL981_03155 [Candidatus Methylacidiphilales bacterium]|nr:hypothetical protein [Candidatus Methylacidiphilales bacterium]
MKMLATVVVVLAFSFGVAQAQSTPAPHDMTGFSAKNAPAINPESSKLAPNPHPDLKPKVGGVFVDGGKYGWVLVSPGADPSYGIGEKYLAAPRQFGPDVDHTSPPGSHRDAGGLKLFSLEF